jgi:hypothetical protein
VQRIPSTANISHGAQRASAVKATRDAMQKRSELTGSIDPYRFTMLPTRMSS